MNRRTTAIALASILATGLTACKNTTVTTNSDPGASTAAGNAKPQCTPIFTEGNGTGITLAHGTITGSMSLTCDPVPVDGQAFTVEIGLEYLSSGNPGNALVGNRSISGYQDTYTTTAPCKPGTWAIGAVIDGATSTGGQPQTVNITDCSATII